MKKICITGASGFIGGSLCKSLINLKIPTIALVRNRNSFLNFLRIEQIQFDELNSKNNLINQSRENALVLKKENQIGILEKGLNANFIIYKSNPFDTANNKIDKTNYIFFILGTEKNNLYPTN